MAQSPVKTLLLLENIEDEIGLIGFVAPGVYTTKTTYIHFFDDFFCSGNPFTDISVTNEHGFQSTNTILSIHEVVKQLLFK